MKIKKIFIILLFIIGCTSCKKEDVFSLDDEYYGKNEIIEITSLDELAKMVEEEKSFALFVYMQGCTTCASFKPVLNSFISKNELTIYEISASVIGDDKDNSVMQTVEYAPSVLLYKKGIPVAWLDANGDEDSKYYKTVDAFSEWWLNYCELKIS